MDVRRVILMPLVAATLVHMASAIPGTATYYNVYTPSSCYGFENQGTMIAKASLALLLNSGGPRCGSLFRIRCTGPTSTCRDGEVVTVKIVDVCPNCGPRQFDLSREAFSAIADPSNNAGIIQIDYNPAA